MRQDRLNHLTLMSLEHEVLLEIDFTELPFWGTYIDQLSELIDKFPKIKALKMPSLTGV